jgi:hypothetical protein
MVVALLFVLTLIQSVVFLISQRMAIRTDALPPWRFLVLDFVFFAVVTMCFLGLIGFGLRVVSGRTGIQRLADINTRPAARGPFR